MPRDMLTRGCICLRRGDNNDEKVKEGGDKEGEQAGGINQAVGGKMGHGSQGGQGGAVTCRPGEETCLLTVVEAPWIAESARLAVGG